MVALNNRLTRNIAPPPLETPSCGRERWRGDDGDHEIDWVMLKELSLVLCIFLGAFAAFGAVLMAMGAL